MAESANPGPWGLGRRVPTTKLQVKAISSEDWPALDSTISKVSSLRVEPTVKVPESTGNGTRRGWARQSTISHSSDSVDSGNEEPSDSNSKLGQCSTDPNWPEISGDEQVPGSTGFESHPLSEKRDTGAKTSDFTGSDHTSREVASLSDVIENGGSISSGQENGCSSISSGNENGGSSVASDDVGENQGQLGGNGINQQKKSSKLKWKPLDLPELGPLKYNNSKRGDLERDRERDRERERERERKRERELERERQRDERDRQRTLQIRKAFLREHGTKDAPPQPLKFKGVGVSTVNGGENYNRPDQRPSRPWEQPPTRSSGRGRVAPPRTPPVRSSGIRPLVPGLVSRRQNAAQKPAPVPPEQQYYEIPVQKSNVSTIPQADYYNYYDFMNEYAAYSHYIPTTPQFIQPNSYSPALITSVVPEDFLIHLLRQQIEYYFSKENLEKDFFIRRKMDCEGYLPVNLICSFKRIQNMTLDMDLVIRAILTSQVLELKEGWVRTIYNPRGWPLPDLVAKGAPVARRYPITPPRPASAPQIVLNKPFDPTTDLKSPDVEETVGTPEIEGTILESPEAKEPVLESADGGETVFESPDAGKTAEKPKVKKEIEAPEEVGPILKTADLGARMEASDLETDLASPEPELTDQWDSTIETNSESTDLLSSTELESDMPEAEPEIHAQ